MPRITKIYTRGGDEGMTSLGGGQRVKKDSLRIEAYGTVDELSSQIGAAIAAGIDPELSGILLTIQNELFHLGSDLCILEEEKAKRSVPQIEQRHIDALERILDRMTDELGPLQNFILPGGAPAAAGLHLARAVCRRAERRVISLAEREPVGQHVIKYLNRLSDALFVMARYENLKKGVAETYWRSTD